MQDVIRVNGGALVTLIRRNYIAKEMLKNKNLFIRRYILEGMVGKNYLKTALIEKIQGEYFYTRDGNVYVLGQVEKGYQEFMNAFQSGMPILYNWVIGKDNCLSANLYQNNRMRYLSSHIVAQDLTRRTITIEDGTEAFVIWRSINYHLLQYIIKRKEQVNWDKIFTTPDCPLQPDLFCGDQSLWITHQGEFSRIYNSPRLVALVSEDIRNHQY